MDMNAWRISAPWSIGADVLQKIIEGRRESALGKRQPRPSF
jgi:hypothetical protein